MDLTVNDTATEGMWNALNHSTSTLTVVNHFLQTYAYLVVGSMLILVNFPVFLVVMLRKELREPYLVLAVVFLNNGFTGVSVSMLGAKRLFHSGDRNFVDHRICVLSVTVFLLAVFFLNGWSLLMNSVERLCVVAFPLYYYTHCERISYSLIAGHYAVTIIAIASTVVASLIEPSRYISNFCMLQSVYSFHFYAGMLTLESTASLLSVVIMIAVVIILRKKFGGQYLSRYSHNRDLTQFLNKQKQYTHTALISCCFTFFLAVLPSTVEHISMMKSDPVSQFLVMFCVYLRLLNSFNMVVLFFYRQKDFRRTAIQGLKWLFYGRKRHIMPTVTGFIP